MSSLLKSLIRSSSAFLRYVLQVPKIHTKVASLNMKLNKYDLCAWYFWNTRVRIIVQCLEIQCLSPHKRSKINLMFLRHVCMYVYIYELIYTWSHLVLTPMGLISQISSVTGEIELLLCWLSEEVAIPTQRLRFINTGSSFLFSLL